MNKVPPPSIGLNHFAQSARILGQYELIRDPNRLPPTRPISSRHVDGLSDLVVSAPIKEGFIDAFEHVTYETRFRLVMDALFKMRSTSREYNLIKPLLDTTERIQSIRSFRLAIVEIPTETKTEKRLIEAVTFDRPWEPYIRTIWDPLGPMLDLLLCNCEGYVTAGDHSFEEYARWIRENQVDTGFFYATTGLSVGDLHYLVASERHHRDHKPCEASDIAAAAIVSPDFKAEARATRQAHRPESDGIAFEALASLYRLTSYYPLDRPLREGGLLHRAARSLLHGWETDHLSPEGERGELLAWYKEDSFSDRAKRPAPEETYAPEETCNKANVQAGILRSYSHNSEPVVHGCLLFMQSSSGSGARAFLEAVSRFITCEAPGFVPPSLGGLAWKSGVFLNLAVTLRGLRRLEVPAAELARFPQEFLEGAEERAGLLGDLLGNHPRRWRPPQRNWCSAPGGTRQVELNEIDFVLQLRTGSHDDPRDPSDLFQKNGNLNRLHPLAKPVVALAKWARRQFGVQLLSVQPMYSLPQASGTGGSVSSDHFGFLDGFSQPTIEPDKPEKDRVALGELLLGFDNDRGDRRGEKNEYLYEGSFLVVRKIRQHVAALRDWVAEHGATKEEQERLYSLMMGRSRKGEPLAPPGKTDFDFGKADPGTYCPRQSHVRRANPRRKEHGRPGPRIMRRGMSYGPRLEEGVVEAKEKDRGVVFMCYQASIAEQYEVVQRWLNGANSTGLFSAHNDPLTGIGRPQDGRTLRWSDGNKVIRCPLDDTEEGRNRFVSLEWLLYLFVPSLSAIKHIVETGRPKGAELDIGSKQLLDLGTRLIGKLQRGENQLEARYALEPLTANASGPARAVTALLLFIKLAGKTLREQALGARRKGINHLAPVARFWKAILEDFGAKDPAERAYGPAVWSAIREQHGGILRVPYGDFEPGDPTRARPVTRVVLVADRDLVQEVFDDPHGRYSVEGDGDRQARMTDSIGTIYVGLDDGETYRRESGAANRLLYGISEQAAFDDAYAISEAHLKAVLAAAPVVDNRRSSVIELSGKLITPVIADICTQWFGIPDPEGKFIAKGSWRRFGIKPGDPSRCPGDFIAPSRAIFYPDPNPAVTDYGNALGKALKANVKRMYEDMRARGKSPSGLLPDHEDKAVPLLADKIFDSIWQLPLSEEARIDLLTRNVIGAMTGMIPPLDGNLRGAFYGWLKDRSLWRIQRRLRSGDAEDAYDRAVEAVRRPLVEAMQKRPAPDLVLRFAKRTHRLGRLKVRKGERLFLGIVSATLQDHAERDRSACLWKAARHPYRGIAPVFGGLRGTDDALHACPAYKMAMGTMMGMVTALLDSGVIEPHPATLTVQLTER